MFNLWYIGSIIIPFLLPYVWKDTSDRGRSVLAGDAVKKGTGPRPRITETKNKSVSVIKIVNGW